MSDLDYFPTVFDPFTEAKNSGDEEYVHIRLHIRKQGYKNKNLTTVQGVKNEYSYEKILKLVKKAFCCNGVVVQHQEHGKIIQLQGDHRKNVSNFLVQAGIVNKDQIKLHGY